MIVHLVLFLIDLHANVADCRTAVFDHLRSMLHNCGALLSRETCSRIDRGLLFSHLLLYLLP